MRNNKKTANTQKIFVGIDVHLKSWDVTCMSESNYVKSFTQPPEATALFTFLSKEFPNCEYYAVYESGFTGFSTYYSLSALGIHTIVVHAADVPTTQKESVMKTDRRDSRKLAKALKAGQLSGIYVRGVEDLDDRSLVRLRKVFLREESATKIRIRHLLHNNGVAIPPDYEKRWNRAFVLWMQEEAKLLGDSQKSLDLLINHLEVLHQQVLVAGRAVARMIRTDKYAASVKRLVSIPGLGINVAIALLTEIGDFNRFSNQRQFASVLGLIPTAHNSGDTVSTGEKTFRSNRLLSSMIIEAAWKFVAKDAAMNLYFAHCCRTMKKNKAIIKVARRMSNIILSLMKNQVEYDASKTYQ